MKIEKINDNQIRCTLTGEDLRERDILHVSELAYGSQKARSLFRDMMQKAYSEYGFNGDNAPLTIEAIPTSADSIILIITRVEDPEELDTRFSHFTKGEMDTDDPETSEPVHLGADDIMELFRKIRDAQNAAAKGKEGQDSETGRKEKSASSTNKAKEEATAVRKPSSILHLFRFDSLDTVIEAAKALTSMKIGRNSLYRSDRNHESTYLLLLYPTRGRELEFNRLCNILSEYGTGRIYSKAEEALLQEHGELLIRSKALQTLSSF